MSQLFEVDNLDIQVIMRCPKDMRKILTILLLIIFAATHVHTAIPSLSDSTGSEEVALFMTADSGIECSKSRGQNTRADAMHCSTDCTMLLVWICIEIPVNEQKQNDFLPLTRISHSQQWLFRPPIA